MKFTDEMLMAYADGELDLVARAEIEAAIASDPEVARAVERHRALRAQLQSAYGRVLDEPVPEKLAALVAPRARAAAPVADLAVKRAERARDREAVTGARSWVMPEWKALAASVALGVLVGLFLARPPEAPFAEDGGQLLASGPLARALSNRLAADDQGDAIRVGLSFREQAGGYCRTFTLQQEAATAGLACHEGGDWRIQVLARAESAGGEVRTAAAMPLAVLQAVEARIAGEPLDAAAEAAARDSGWQR